MLQVGSQKMPLSPPCLGRTFEYGDRDVNTQTKGAPTSPGTDSSAHKREWPAFLLLAFVGLPISMTLLIAAYGFVVWFLQILFFGPPS